MKLLIITQKVDKIDPILGFFHRWIEEFAKNCDQLTVICLQKGKSELSSDIKIISLGKEKGVNKLEYILNFYKSIWKERKNYDAVFVHMNPVYIILGGVLWNVWNKKIYLWYVHRSVDLKLKIAEKFVETIFTASKSSFLLDTRKVAVMGHGIDVSIYNRDDKMPKPENIVLQVGRITQIKHCDTLIEAVAILKQKISDTQVWFIGLPISESDKVYQDGLINLAKKLGISESVKFKGSVPNNEMYQYYAQSSVLVNSSPIGLFDKVVFESMAAKVPVVTSNEFFADYVGKYKDILLYKEGDVSDLQNKIGNIISSKKLSLEIGEFLFEQVKEKVCLDKLIKNICSKIKSA